MCPPFRAGYGGSRAPVVRWSPPGRGCDDGPAQARRSVSSTCSRRAACRMMAAGAAALVTVSEDLSRFFCHTTGTPLDRVRVIYNGIDLRGGSAARRRNVELLDSAGIPREAKIVGAVGNLYPVKGHLDLIRAAKLIVMEQPTAHIVILGRGTLHDDLLAE